MVTTPPGASSPRSGACPGSTPSSPSVVRAMTMLASPDQIVRSTATNSTCRVATSLLGIRCGTAVSGGAERGVDPTLCAPGSSLLELVGVALEVLEPAAHEEGL